MRHLMEAGILANKGSLPERVKQFAKLTRPILTNPCKTFKWKVGASQTTAYAGKVNGTKVVVFVFDEGQYAGKVATAIIPDANQVVGWKLWNI